MKQRGAAALLAVWDELSVAFCMLSVLLKVKQFDQLVAAMTVVVQYN